MCAADRPPIADGAVIVDENEILTVGQFSTAQKTVSMNQAQILDLGDGAIIPGLVNAHTHLEFSDLEQPLGQPGISFTDWIRKIVGRRNESNQESDLGGQTNKKSRAIKLGIEESRASGVWAIGEISTLPYQRSQYQGLRSNMTMLCFLEQLGRDETTFNQKRIELEKFLQQPSPTDNTAVHFGCSPHAPYSVAPGLLNQMCRQSVAAGRPVAMHLAETLIERELIEHQTGEFVALLQDYGVWNPDSFNNGLSIAETIEVLASAPRSLIVHGNYLSDTELDIVAGNSDRQSIVFCPRTHDFFRHSVYPLEKMLERNINVCLGTDSRASNPDLDLFKEAKHVASSFSQLDPKLIFKMATLGGAIALGINHSHGNLAVGKTLALSFVSHPNAATDQSPFEWMFDIKSTCTPLSVILGSGV